MHRLALLAVSYLFASWGYTLLCVSCICKIKVLYYHEYREYTVIRV